MSLIAPSFLAADIWRISEQITNLEQEGCRYLHLDIMDGCFVPNISFGVDFVKSLRPRTAMTFDAHLMVEEPDRFVEDFAAAGVELFTVHGECCRHLHRTIQHIRDAGMRPGVALNPATPIAVLDEILDDLELVLVMSVNPGFCGQQFIAGALSKVRRLAARRAEMGAHFLLEVDGGIKLANGPVVAQAGADLLVAGSAVFGATDYVDAYCKLAAAVE
ncbi:MAG: ribulose-phosphate 3-epimerase [Clostridiales bacterium]